MTDNDPTSSLAELVQGILALQPQHSAHMTDAMVRRRDLIGALGTAVESIAQACPDRPAQLSTRWSTGAGGQSRVPWVRVFDPDRSPGATQGWYVMLLFAADGSAAYLSLGLGTQSSTRGQMAQRGNEWVDSQTQWARSILRRAGIDLPSELIDLRNPGGPGESYARGTAVGFKVGDQEGVDEVEFVDRLGTLLSMLRVVYAADPPTEPAAGPPDPERSTRLSGLVERTLWTTERLHELLDSLSGDMPHVLLAGPPGTSKSHVALAVADHLTGNDPDRTTLVQFHPSYGYESFVEGLRPTLRDGSVVFDVVPGTVVKVADQARNDPDHTYVLVVDEMNRANVARVFGELMVLLEYRDHPVDLQHSTGFTLPPNIVLIATMNTADRSIRGIDAALRRRFEIFECPPDPDFLHRWFARPDNTNDVEGLVDGFQKLNKHLTTALDRHHTIGHTYFRTTHLTHHKLRTIWERKIHPLVEEYFFDDPNEAASYTLTTFWPTTDA